MMAQGKSESKEAVAATAITDHDRAFVQELTQIFHAQRADARVLDSFLRGRLELMVVDRPKMLTIGAVLMMLRNDESSVEEKCQCAREYVGSLILACTILKEEKYALRCMHAMLQWVVSVFLPKVGDRVYMYVEIGSESVQVTRSSVIELLSGTYFSSHVAPNGQAVLSYSSSSAVLSAPAAGQAVDSVVHVPSEASRCERCYSCFFMTPKRLLVCSYKSSGSDEVISSDSDKVLCSVGYCNKCIPNHRSGAFMCAKHQGRPAQRSKIFARGKCWDCPPDTIRPARTKGLRSCHWCGKEKCPVCGLYDEACLTNSSWTFICLRCRDDPTSLDKDIVSRMMALVCKALGISQSNVDHFSASMITTDRVVSGELQKLADFVFDVSLAGLHELALPFTKIVIDVDIFLANRQQATVTSPSQYSRMFSGTPESRRVLEILSMAYARELVTAAKSKENDSFDDGMDGLRDRWDAETSARWAQFREAVWQTQVGGRPKAMLWMHDAAVTSPTVGLVSYLLTELSKSEAFSSIILCGRKASNDCSHHKDDGAVSKLLECFQKTGKLKLFEPNDSDDVILKFLEGEDIDITVDFTSYSSGGIPSVLARLRTAVHFAYIGYPGLHYGIYAFVMLSKDLLNEACMQSLNRERFVICDGIYPSVGYHNGHHDTMKDWKDKLVVPEGRRPLLVFLGDGTKIRDESVYAWFDILAGTGYGPDSALLMLLESTDTVVRAVERWRLRYNERRESADEIKPGRIQWFPYRSKQELWAWLFEIRDRAISISCLGPFDVHTLVNDSLWSCLCHLALRTPGQDWTTLVAANLVQLAGLGEWFIANSVEDFKDKGIKWCLISSQPLLLEASNHLLECRDRQIGHFNLKQPVLNLERALILGWTQYRKAGGVRGKFSDVDLTEAFPVRETRPFLPRAKAEVSISESDVDQARRILNQLETHFPKVLERCKTAVEKVVCLNHRLGFSKMRVEGVGSTTICINAVFEGKEHAIKATHFFRGKIQQEDRLVTDAVIKATYCLRKACLRRSRFGKLMLPEIYDNYPGNTFVAVVQGNVQMWSGKNPVRSRPVICCCIAEFVPGGTLSTHSEYQGLVSEFTNHGIISDDLTRVIQAILFTAHFMNSKGIVNFDISDNNLALRKIGHRWIAVWIDTGASIVFGARAQAPLAQRSITSVATDEPFTKALPAAPAQALFSPSIPKYVNGISYINGEKVDSFFEDARCRQELTCWGQDTFREEEFIDKLRSDQSRKVQLTLQDGMRVDSWGSTATCLQMFHPAPKSKIGRDKWKKDLSEARDSPEKMVAFLQAGLRDGVTVERPDVLTSYGKLFYDLLRKDVRDRITVHRALLSLVLTTDTLSLREQRIMDGDGFVFPASDCPEGSPWHDKGQRQCRVIAMTEPGIGAGIKIDQDIREGQLVILYAGTEVSEDTGIDLEDLPPSRRTTYAKDGTGRRIHVVADQPFGLLRQNNTAGPLVNAALNVRDANLTLRRTEFWRDGKGNVYMGLYAKKDIARGTFLRWEYDPFAGGGGSNSFRFE